MSAVVPPLDNSHTPGPWEAVPNTNNGWEVRAKTPELRFGGGCEIHSTSGSGFPVVQTIGFQPWGRFTPKGYDEMVEANFRVLAAAPELLESLKMLSEVANSAQCLHALEKARAAIAKAEGK